MSTTDSIDLPIRRRPFHDRSPSSLRVLCVSQTPLRVCGFSRQHASHRIPHHTHSLPVAAIISDERQEETEAPPPRCEPLPPDVLRRCLEHLSAMDLAQAARVNRLHHQLATEAWLWRAHCLRVWGTHTPLSQLTAEAVRHGGWRRMFCQRRRLRYDGVYIQKQQFLRLGGDDGSGDRRVFFVSFYRYLRFFPTGAVLGLTTPDDPLTTRSRLQTPYVDADGQVVLPHGSASTTVHRVGPVLGEYAFDEASGRVQATLPAHQPKYPGMHPETVCYTLRLFDSEERRRGANNRLTLLEHASLSGGASQPLRHQIDHAQATFSFTPFGAWYKRVAETLFADSDDVKMFNRMQLLQRRSWYDGGLPLSKPARNANEPRA